MDEEDATFLPDLTAPPSLLNISLDMTPTAASLASLSLLDSVVGGARVSGRSGAGDATDLVLEICDGTDSCVLGSSDANWFITGGVTVEMGVTGVLGVTEVAEFRGAIGVVGVGVAVSAASMAFATAFLAFGEEASLLLDLDLGLEVAFGFSVDALTGDSELAVVADGSVTAGLVTKGFGASGTPNEFPRSWLLASLADELCLLPSSPVELPPKGMSPF